MTAIMWQEDYGVRRTAGATAALDAASRDLLPTVHVKIATRKAAREWPRRRGTRGS
jgi:hypothetical protein